MLMTRRLLRWPLLYLLTLLHLSQMFSLRLPMRLPPFWLCQPTPRWLMPPRLLWSPYLRCSPQMLRMRLPVWLMLLPLRLHSLL
ncbi:hypothetical protein CH222_24280, partial [Salmonella enterica subsp. enterica serovar Enteritidis]|nr:hypothetical protein [Salmonella enterica subsp. enterica serovar Enteritidis]EDN2827380.1 hypothetical protein [Salmonella enterica subsp. enterica serovar Enteritidis]